MCAISHRKWCLVIWGLNRIEMCPISRCGKMMKQLPYKLKLFSGVPEWIVDCENTQCLFIWLMNAASIKSFLFSTVKLLEIRAWRMNHCHTMMSFRNNFQPKFPIKCNGIYVFWFLRFDPFDSVREIVKFSNKVIDSHLKKCSLSFKLEHWIGAMDQVLFSVLYHISSICIYFVGQSFVWSCNNQSIYLCLLFVIKKENFFLFLFFSRCKHEHMVFGRCKRFSVCSDWAGWWFALGLQTISCKNPFTLNVYKHDIHNVVPFVCY